MKHDQLIIFDFDDTLVDTSDKYWRARTSFIQALTEEGFDPGMVLEEFEKVDSSHMETLKFSPDRYGKSMFVTYNRILARQNRYPTSGMLSRIKSFGRIILEQPPEPISGAKKLLDWCSKHFALALLTRGDETFQNRKLHHVGFFKYFDLVRVVSKKDAGAFKQVMEELAYPPEKTWIIGDSIRSDVNPGIEIGANCILYMYRHPVYSWVQEYGCLPIGPFYKANTLLEIKDILKKPLKFVVTTSLNNSFQTSKAVAKYPS